MTRKKGKKIGMDERDWPGIWGTKPALLLSRDKRGVHRGLGDRASVQKTEGAKLEGGGRKCPGTVLGHGPEGQRGQGSRKPRKNGP